MFKKFSFLLILFLLIFASISFSTTKLLIYPSISPDGKYIAFSYMGDIWIADTSGKDILRLTANPADDIMPLWTPDGKTIVFASNRDGDYDIYKINLYGGGPEQLTFHSDAEYPEDISPDGKFILFRSHRNFHYHRPYVLFKININGGNPTRVINDFSSFGAYSPDGKKLAFIRKYFKFQTRKYKGGAHPVIWIHQNNKFEKAVDFDCINAYPLWKSDNELIFVSDKDGMRNFYIKNLTNANIKQITNFNDNSDLFNPHISFNKKYIVFEKNFEIYKLNLTNNEINKINLNIEGDCSFPLEQEQKLSSNFSGFSISHDNKEVAFTAFGHLVIKTWDYQFQKIITQSIDRVYETTFSPDGKYLLFVWDKDTSKQIYKIVKEKELYVFNEKNNIIPFITDIKEVYSPLFSPDGKYLLFQAKRGEIYLKNLKTNQTIPLKKSVQKCSYSWSPDSRFIATTITDNDFNTDIWIYSIKNKTWHNVTVHPKEDTKPIWTPDGKRLLFISNRKQNKNEIFYIPLEKEEIYKTNDQLKYELSKKKKNKKNNNVIVKIDFDNIAKRVKMIEDLPGDKFDIAVSNNAKSYYFLTSTAEGTFLMKVNWDGKQIEKISKGRYRALKPNKDYLYLVTSNGTLQRVKWNSKKTEKFSANVKISFNYKDAWKQMLKEGWNALNYNFYDPNFHGINWKKIYEKYSKLVDYVYNPETFYYLVNIMLGELNSSHLGIYKSRRLKGISKNCGFLGVQWNNDLIDEGIFEVEKILKGSPVDIYFPEVKKGWYLININNKNVANIKSLDKELIGLAGKNVKVIFAPNKEGKGAISRQINFISYYKLRDLLYENWVLKNRKYVDQKSNNKLGYLHIRGMNWPSFEVFEQELFSVGYNKDAIIIDVRNNGGGWTADYLLTILSRKPHALTKPRDGGFGYPNPRFAYYGWNKKSVLLCNFDSFSNAEIFSHGYKTLKLGKLIGTPTYGGVISTGGTTLLDGSYFRIPFRGWYVIGDTLNMEHHGAIPDYIIETMPEDEYNNIDRQLDKAIEILLNK